jgi:hypothetical protein
MSPSPSFDPTSSAGSCADNTAALETKTAELGELRNRVEGMQQSLDEANATVAPKDVGSCRFDEGDGNAG